MGLFGLFLVRVLMKHLLTFLILFGFIGHGLSQVQAVSFRDYKNCTYGFRIGSKEVWPPVFNCFTDSTTEIRTCNPKVFSRTFDLRHEFRVVFPPDARSQELLKELIYKGLNEKQFPGVNCVEIERLLKTYNTQFYVGTNGLNLYLLTNGEQQVFAIPFRDLASILNPELKAHLHKGFYL